MKTIFTVIAIIIGFYTLKAQNLIAVEHNNVSTFYTTFDDAYNVARNGDTIYLPGGYFSVTNPINKKLFIYGSGFNTDSSQATGITAFSNSIDISPLASGGLISGITVSDGSLSIHDTVNNYTISRCLFGNLFIGSGEVATPASNINIIETVITGQLISNCAITYPKNVVVLNSFIGNTDLYGYGFPCIGANDGVWKGLICRNCILFGRTYCNFGCSYLISSTVQNSSFENCIIMDLYGGWSIGGSYNTYTNCLSNQSASYITSDNSILNCFFDQGITNTFVLQQGNTYDIHNNYHLQGTSVGHNAGDDGTDIGLYGGTSPWKDGSMPSNPHIISKTISSSTDVNGNISVNIKVEAQKD